MQTKGGLIKMELEHTISKAPNEGNEEPEVIASFKQPTDRDDFFNLLEEKYPDVNWIIDGE